MTLNPDGSFSYPPTANWHGTDTFTYKANDGQADSNVATVTITVTPVNDVPVAVDDGFETDEDVTLSVPPPGVLANDTDADGDPLTALLVSGPANGAVTLNPDGSFSYQPTANWHGTDTFTYKANDGQADSQRGHGHDHGHAGQRCAELCVCAGRCERPVATEPQAQCGAVTWRK